jgi:uncharacterized protein
MHYVPAFRIFAQEVANRRECLSRAVTGVGELKKSDARFGSNEELTSPALGPTARQERVSSIDVLRGVALMGILIANVTSFGLPSWAYYVPLGIPKPAFEGTYAHVNTVVWFARWIVIEGKMRGLFSMLFGAGVILLTSRAEQRGVGDKAVDIFLRRNMWLVLFGILHAYLVWFGDFLYWYGLTALLFLYPCRKLKSKTLLIAGGCVLTVNLCGSLAGGQPLQDMYLSHKAAVARALQREGKELSDSQKADQRAWGDRLRAWKPDREMIADDITATRAGYLSAEMKDAPEAMAFESHLYYTLGVCDVLGMMLLGMGLVKNGFLTAKLSYKTYAMTAVFGLLVSVPVVALGTWKAWISGFDVLTTEKWIFFPYDVGRASGAIATAAIVLLVVKARIIPGVVSLVAAVGRMALSNYLLTSIFCKMLFVWGPWKLYGKLEYYQLYYVVLAAWSVNLAWSTIWLKYFEFGPAEWVWRSLTYWKRQPMRLRASLA